VQSTALFTSSFLTTESELRVPVERLEVTVQTLHDRRRGVIFLSPNFDLKAFFEDEPEFFPVEDDTGHIHLYARSSVMSLATAPDAFLDGPADAELGIHYEDRPVAVHLKNGTVLYGSLRAPVSPCTRRVRTLDLLNEPTKSFAMRAGDLTLIVAKAHVTRIEEIR
jgi:hypothetical protein